MIKSPLLDRYKNISQAFFEKGDSIDGFINSCLIRDLFILKQTHSATVIENPKPDQTYEGDGAIIESTGAIGIRTADCLPVYLYDPNKNLLSGLHAGWKGLASGILENAITSMLKKGSEVKNISCIVGPHVCFKCYSVPTDRIPQFSKDVLIPNQTYKKENDVYFLNLGEIARLKFLKFGVLKENIDIMDICTYEKENLYSYRRGNDVAPKGTVNNIVGFIQ